MTLYQAFSNEVIGAFFVSSGFSPWIRVKAL